MGLDTIPINQYSGSQQIVVADRVILNSVLDDIYILSSKNLVIGSQGELHINSKKNILINVSGSSKIIYGNPDERGGLQPNVLGTNIYKMLNEITTVLSTLQVDTASGPGLTSQQTLESINQIKDTYLKEDSESYILSDFVFTSNNKRK